MRVRGVAVAACLAFALLSCSANPADDAAGSDGTTTVLGAATERPVEAAPTPTPTPSRTPLSFGSATPTETATGRLDSSDPATPTPTADPAQPVATHTTSPVATATPVPTHAPGNAPQPTTLASGPGWSMNTLLPDADGEGWTEVGGAPPIESDGTSAERLLTQLVHDGAAGDPAGRRARCHAWIEAVDGKPLVVQGEAVVELLVGDDAVARSSHTLDVVVEAGHRFDLPPWQRPTHLHAAEGASVSCVVWFSGA